MTEVQDLFRRNRAEEFSRDVFADFVVPPFFGRLPIRTQTKALVIEGGRGCGKTTLLNYFCHPTMFSPKQPEASIREVSYVGLYYRADTNFLAGLQGDEHPDKVYLNAFKHSLSYNIAMELAESLESINCTDERRDKFGRLESLDFSELEEMFGISFGRTLADFKKSLERLKTRLAMWLNNPKPDNTPDFLTPEIFLTQVIRLLQVQLPYLADVRFAVFIDEYENLLEYQQQYINGLLKHGRGALLFNIAMKHNGFLTRRTLTNESLQQIHDFILIDLEHEQEKGFELFAAEVMLFKLVEGIAALGAHVPIDPALLRRTDDESLRIRCEDAQYRKQVLNCAERLLPKMTEREVAVQVLTNKKLRTRLAENIADGLKKFSTSLTVEDFIRDDMPEASVVSGCLLNRRRETPEAILEEMEKLKLGELTKFGRKSSDWTQNNLFGALLQIYAVARVPCPLYAGFDSFVLISKGNLRHFLELTRRAFETIDRKTIKDLPQVDVEAQAEVVRQAAYAFLNEVRGAGTAGNQLYGMVLTLGAIFRQKQRAVEQSEPEINHFSVSRGAEFSEALARFLAEAIKWSVLFDEPETKEKNPGVPTRDYILNPIFAGHFQISFRKRRAIPLTEQELMIMFAGKLEDKDKMVRTKVGALNANLSLELDLGP